MDALFPRQPQYRLTLGRESHPLSRSVSRRGISGAVNARLSNGGSAPLSYSRQACGLLERELVTVVLDLSSSNVPVLSFHV